MNEQYDYINKDGEPAKTKVVAVLNQKGGVGKTTTAANLAYQLGKDNKQVLVIDFDSQASLTNYFNVGLDNDDYLGIYEMLLRELRDDKTLIERIWEMKEAQSEDLADILDIAKAYVPDTLVKKAALIDSIIEDNNSESRNGKMEDVFSFFNEIENEMKNNQEGEDQNQNEEASQEDYDRVEDLISDFETMERDIQKGEAIIGKDLGQLFSEIVLQPTYTDIVSKKIDGIKKLVSDEVPFGIDLLPSRLMLSDYELEIKNAFHGLHLRTVVREIIKVKEYDYIIIDCNPSLGILSSNALIAATSGILIPTNLDIMSTRGIRNLIDRLVDLQLEIKSIGIDHMGVIGIVLNLYGERRTVDKTLEHDMERFYPFKIFDAHIPESINAKKAALLGITYSQMYKKADEAYKALKDEFVAEIEKMEQEGPKIKRISRRKMNVTVPDEKDGGNE